MHSQSDNIGEKLSIVTTALGSCLRMIFVPLYAFPDSSDGYAGGDFMGTPRSNLNIYPTIYTDDIPRRLFLPNYALRDIKLLGGTEEEW